MKKLKVLYAEDEIDTRTNHIEYISDQYDLEFIEADNGEDAYLKYIKHKPDIILTDISMPKLCGLELIRNIRQKDKDIRIIVLSAYGDQDKLLQAIELNLISYQIKPINRKNLKDSLGKAIDSINKNHNLNTIYHFDKNTYFNLESLILIKNEDEIKLTTSEKKLLKFLINNANQILSSEELFYHLWDLDKNYNSNSIRTMIKNLRKKIPENSIENIYGGNYKLTCL